MKDCPLKGQNKPRVLCVVNPDSLKEIASRDHKKNVNFALADDQKVRLVSIVQEIGKATQVRSMPVLDGLLNGQSVHMLRDTCSSTVIIRHSLISKPFLTGKTL